VIRGVGGIVDEAGAACVYAAGEEGHAERLVVRDSLEGADEVSTLKILELNVVSIVLVRKQGVEF
jgi:hypothetical protein